MTFMRVLHRASYSGREKGHNDQGGELMYDA